MGTTTTTLQNTGPLGSGASNGVARQPGEEGRWNNRPALAATIRAVAFVIPLAASLAAAWVVAELIPRPDDTASRVLAWVGVLSASLLALVVFDHLARRLLPLAALLKLSMVFPDRAPSRMGVALRSGSTKRLQDRAVRDLREGKQEPALAAHTILALAASLSAHDKGTRGHSERVRAYADLIAEELRLEPAERDRLRWAALLHDLGKLSVPAHTLNAHHALTDDDWETLRRHPIEGARLAAPLKGWLGPWVTAIEQHHERYDGTGYPYGLSGEQLSLAARIVAVADAYDAMTSVRSYSPGVSPAVAREELAKQAGTHFDPAVVRAFLNVSIGRIRWVMGPLAFLSVVPFAPGLGALRRATMAAGRTATLGAASVAATVAAITPGLRIPEPSPPAQVMGELSERPAPPRRAASTLAPPEVPAPPAPIPPAAPPADLPPEASSVTSIVAQAPRAAQPVAVHTVAAPAPTVAPAAAPPPPAAATAPPPAPAPAPGPAPATGPPHGPPDPPDDDPNCRDDGKSERGQRPCRPERAEGRAQPRAGRGGSR